MREFVETEEGGAANSTLAVDPNAKQYNVYYIHAISTPGAALLLFIAHVALIH